MEKIESDTRMYKGERVKSLNEDKATLDSITKTDLGPLLVIFCLFILGVCLFSGGIILFIQCKYLILAFFLFVTIFCISLEVWERLDSESLILRSINRICSDTEKWLILLKWLLPRKHRESIIGDILEDCHEMRERRLSKQRIMANVLWQLIISFLMWVPSSVINAIFRLLGAK